MTTTKKCKGHTWWHRVETNDYVCANCGKTVMDQPPDLTFKDCKKCDKYPCEIGCSIPAQYNEEYRKRNHIPESHRFLIHCNDKRKARKRMGGFIDIDGRHYPYAPNQQPVVHNVPFNVEGSGGLVYFTAKCKCCNKSKGYTMWEPQFEKFKKEHQNFTTKVKWYLEGDAR
jgi:hypothetical protein